MIQAQENGEKTQIRAQIWAAKICFQKSNFASH